VPVDTPTGRSISPNVDRQTENLIGLPSCCDLRYAEAHGSKIVQAYEDKGRNWLTTKHRER
jgi:hypothetical protein